MFISLVSLGRGQKRQSRPFGHMDVEESVRTSLALSLSVLGKQWLQGATVKSSKLEGD